MDFDFHCQPEVAAPGRFRHMYVLTAGQSSTDSPGDAADTHAGAAPHHAGTAPGEGHRSDLCTAGRHQGGQTVEHWRFRGWLLYFFSSFFSNVSLNDINHPILRSCPNEVWT